MLHRRFIIRQITRSPVQALLVVLCVGLALITLVALDGFGHSVRSALRQDAKQLHAADILVRSNTFFSPAIEKTIQELKQARRISTVRTYEFYSVVRPMSGEGSLLAQLKVVQPGYPFYGQVRLKSGRSFADVLQTGRILVDPVLLDRLNLRRGDRLHVGDAVLTIADEILVEPDRPVTFFAFGPRIFVAGEDLDALNLVDRRSRVRHRYLVKAHADTEIDPLAEVLRAAAGEQERVYTYKNARPRIQRYFDNFLVYLGVVALFTLLLGGIGIQAGMSAFLREKTDTIAIMKTLGATSSTILRQYLFVGAVLALGGTIIGFGGGIGLQFWLPRMFRGLVPVAISPQITVPGVLQALVLGFGLTAVFGGLPLYRLKGVTPAGIFRRDRPTARTGRWAAVVSLGTIFIGFAVIAAWHLGRFKFGVVMAAGVLIAAVIVVLLLKGIMAGLGARRIRNLPVRQAVRGLMRPGNATVSIAVTLCLACTAVSTIFLVERNLNRFFTTSFPADAPNLFFLDIQPDQLEQFKKALQRPAQYYPIVRARIASVNGRPIDPAAERRRMGDNLARTFNLTYRASLLPNESIVQGGQLFPKSPAKAKAVPMSLLDEVQAIRPLEIGDHLTFNIQGVPVRTVITSIRTRSRQALQPFFYFVFQPDDLKAAPHTIFTGVRVPPDQRGKLQRRIVAQFPNISVIDVGATLKTLSGIMAKFSRIILFFMAFSLLAGFLILISSIWATRFARIRETVYYKILGARSGFALKVLTLENVFLGGISSGMAVVIAHLAAWLICTEIFGFPYIFLWVETLMMWGVPVFMVMAVGGWACRPVLKQKPSTFLRSQSAM